MSVNFYVGLFPKYLLAFTHFYFSCHFGTFPWTFIVHKLQKPLTCSNNDKTSSIKEKQRMLIELSIFQFELNHSKDNAKSNQNVR